jgi:hypothetical protein
VSTPPKDLLADPRALAAELDRALRETPDNVPAICLLGGAAHRLGLVEAAARAFSRAVEILMGRIRARDPTNAMAVENAIYQSFVKAVEDEDHYERAFARWREPLAQLGRDMRLPLKAAPAPLSLRRVGFLLPAGVMLGHTEVLFRLIESCDRSAVDPRIYLLERCDPDFMARAAALGIPVAAFAETPSQSRLPINYYTRLLGIRERLAQEGVASLVWVSVPATASFAFAMRMAPVQTFWSLRYHPVRLPEIDGYLTYGSWAEQERVFHGQRWTVCPVPLALDPRPRPAEAVRELRARFAQKVLLGTLAREEKIASRPFLECVARILERHPDCGYLWTGQARHAGIEAFFRERGLAGRCHFVGWVDTPLYAAALDIFLETFPLGCGVTGYQAMGAGIPFLSYLDSNTVFGMQYWSELEKRAGSAAAASRGMLDEYPVLCARDPDEYVELASRLIADAAYREQWRERERRFFDEEIRGIARYSTRFFDTVRAVAAHKLPGIAA